MTAQAVSPRSLATVIGLEVHVQLETETKIFCGCSTALEAAPPNANTCPVCLGLPGALPVLNEAALEAGIKLAKALDAEIPETTVFHRKNYFYPDLPKNFQITQYDRPLCRNGGLEIQVGDENREIGIQRAHLEEDPGSLRHVGGSIATAHATHIDYNRAGIPLVEIVTEPDFREPGETRAFLATLEEVLEYLDIFDSQRDGSLRVDANISLVDEAAVGDDGSVDEAALQAANRTEVKNISSHKGAERALAYEVTRQRNAIQRGAAVEQETRHWDEARGVTVSMRSKEAEKDYRYFREADLPAIGLREVADRVTIPELPRDRRERFREEYGLDREAASKVTASRQLADFYEAVAEAFDPDLAATWVADNLLGELHYRDLDIEAVTGRLDEFRRLIELVAEDTITVKNAEEVVLRSMLDEAVDPDTVVEREGLGKTADEAVAEAVHAAIDNNPDAVEDYADGEDGAINFLVGRVMARTGGRADPGTVNRLLREALEEE